MAKNLPVLLEAQVQSLAWEDPPEREMAPHSSILARRIPWTEKPNRSQSMGHKELGTTEQLSLLLLTSSL